MDELKDNFIVFQKKKDFSVTQKVRKWNLARDKQAMRLFLVYEKYSGFLPYRISKRFLWSFLTV
jgi:hypothetical protein